MHSDTVSGPNSKPSATTLAGLTAAAIAAAVVPALAGLAFLISLATRRPLIGKAARRWPWLTSYPPGGLPYRTQAGLTAAWGIGLLAAGAAQAAGAISGGLTITSPASFTTRALIALAAEAALTVITVIWLHRKPGPRTLSAATRQHRGDAQPIRVPFVDPGRSRSTTGKRAAATVIKGVVMTRLTFDIYMRATPEDIWRALTDPAITPRYRFGLSFDTDWRPGSPLTSHSPDGQGLVHDSLPGKRLAYSWAETAKPEANGGHPSTVTFELTPMGEVTRLTTTHDNLAPDGPFLRIVQPGWPMILSALKSLLETGEPLTYGVDS